MTDPVEHFRAAFRLNLEQQKKQAKELLKAVKASDLAALDRMRAGFPETAEKLRQGTLKLADAQHAIARELRFANWAGLKAHIESLDDARDAILNKRGAPDSDIPTLHLRCGCDIQSVLVDGGFNGDFLEVSYPYCHGPITAGPGHFEREARFLVDFAGKHMDVSYEGTLAGRHIEEQQLAASAAKHERIVLWMEHDCFDQLVLVRCLAHYASAGAPRVLELIDINYFPGRRPDGKPVHFLGIGHLPEEALRLLWKRRQPVTRNQLDLAADVWNALTLDDPRQLVAIMRTGAPALSHLGFALRRFVQELPSVKNGLSLTESLILEILSERSFRLNQLWARMTYHRDPLPFATDLMLLGTVEYMETLSEPALARTPGETTWLDTVTITDAGRAVLRGARDWLSLQPPPRWVGGILIRPGQRNWRWDEDAQQASLL